MAGTALANDDVTALMDDPANVVMPSINYSGWNYSTLDQITLDNVADLQVAWTWQIGILDSHEASPLVVGDIDVHRLAEAELRLRARPDATTASSCGNSAPT